MHQIFHKEKRKLIMRKRLGTNIKQLINFGLEIFRSRKGTLVAAKEVKKIV